MKILVISNRSTISGGEIVLQRVFDENEEWSPMYFIPEGSYAGWLRGKGCSVTTSRRFRESGMLKEGRIRPLGYAVGFVFTSVALIRLCWNYRPEVIIGNGLGSSLYVLLLKVLFLARAWVIHHHPIFRTPVNFRERLIGLLLYPFGIISVSKAARKSLELIGVQSRNVNVVYGGVDLMEFDPSLFTLNDFKRNHLIPIEIPIIVLPAAITPWKGHVVFIKSLEVLAKRNLKAVGIICGEPLNGDDALYLEQLKKMARDCGMPVLFPGRISPIQSIYRDACVMVNASIEPEPLGAVTYEAMAMGVCVVGSAAGGTMEIIEDGENGFLYPAPDVASLANRLEYLLKNENIRKSISRRARESVNLKFNIKKTCACYKSLLTKADGVVI